MAPAKRIAVVGGGIAGLACCHALKRLDCGTFLLDDAPHFGGVIETITHDGLLFEKGPQSFLATEPALNLIREVGLEPELLAADPHAPRYVLLRGKLVAVPMAPQALLTSSLLSTRSKLRLIREPLFRIKPIPREESVADFVRRKFGSEILDYLVAPFISGIYAGDPELLSFPSAFPFAAQWEKEYGSVLRGAMKTPRGAKRPSLSSFRAGMGALPAAIAQSLGGSAIPGASVQSIRRDADSPRPIFKVKFERSTTADEVSVDAVVLASPAYSSARLIEPLCPTAATELSQIPYAPIAVIAAAYFRKQVEHPLSGFGFLIPRTEGLRTLGTVWNSSLFPGRAPAGQVLLTSFAGGATDISLIAEPAEKIGALVHKELSDLLNISGPPLAQHVFCYPRALPQYNLGHAERLARIRVALGSAPGIFLAGNYLEGPSIGSCVEQSARTAESVRSYLAGT
jgi:oxygen-dependent protoporphyrinogen oxidase